MRRWPFDPYLGAVLLLSVFAIWPLFSVDFLWGADAFLHLFRTFELEEALRQGELLPRWIPTFAFGYGYPLFNFYPPLFYYLTALAHLSGLGWDAAMKALPAASVPLAGLGMYLLMRDFFGPRGGLLSAVAYMYLPYAMLNIYARAAGPESLATSLLPLALWALRRALRPEGWAGVVLAGALLAAIVLTHNITGLLFIPVVAAYSAMLALTGGARFQSLVRTAAVLALGLGLSAFYWLPAWLELQYTLTARMEGGDPVFFRLFTEPGQLIQRGFIFDYSYSWFWQAGGISLCQALLALVSPLGLLRKRGEATTSFAFFAVMALLASLLMTTPSQALWRNLPSVTYIQFPWRLLAYVGLGFSFCGGALASVGPRWLQWGVVAALSPLLMASAMLGLEVQDRYISPEMVSRPYYARYEKVTKIVGTTSVIAQFLPRWVEDQEAMVRPRRQPWPDEVNPGPLPQLTVEKHDGRDIELFVQGETPHSLIFHILYFPGWTAYIDGHRVDVQPLDSLGLCLLSLDVPAGAHQVEVRFEDTTPRLAGEAIALLALLAGLALLVVNRRWGWVTGVGFVLVLALGLWLLVPKESAALTPAQEDFGAALRLVGWRAQPQGDSLRLELLWYALDDLDADLVEVLRLVDEEGQTISSKEKGPYFGTSPSSRWRKGELVLDRQELFLPPDASSGRYALELGLRRPDGSLLPTAEGPFASIGAVFIPVPPPKALPAMTPRQANLDGKILLLGYRLEGGQAGAMRRVSPGERLDLTLFWQAQEDVGEDYAVFVHLHDKEWQNLTQQDSNPDEGEDLRFTSVWERGRLMEDRYRLEVPADAAPGVYYLSTGMYLRRTLKRLPVVGEGDRAVLEPIKVPLGPSPPPQHRLNAALDNGITLVGYDLAAEMASPGEAVEVMLQWRADERAAADYTVFVHLTDAMGQVLAQADAQPRGGSYSTSAWDPGEVVPDPHRLALPADLPAGEYQLRVGMYLWPEGIRAKLHDGDDYAILGRLRVEAE